MRRSDKEIKDITEIESIIKRCKVCRLGLSDEGQPYVVPLNFGYNNNTLYFHCAREGKKINILRKNNKVCVEFDILNSITLSDKACGCTTEYESVIGFGEAIFIENIEKKKKALNILMDQYSALDISFSEAILERTTVFKVEIATITGKQNK